VRKLPPIVYALGAFSVLIITAILLTTSIAQSQILMRWIASIDPPLPLPEITRGEFPFRVEYTIDGETFIVEDVYIAEFAGLGFSAGVGRYRRWNGYIQSSGLARVHVLTIDELRTIYISIGGPAYYMGDVSIELTTYFTPSLVMVASGGDNPGIGRRDELFRPYNVELINWEISSPIVNTFR